MEDVRLLGLKPGSNLTVATHLEQFRLAAEMQTFRLLQRQFSTELP